MNLKELSQKRYSVRAYLSKEVEDEKLEYVLECARLAPSACNYQPWFFYVVASDEIKTKIRKTYDREWFKAAPVYIVVCGDHQQSWKRAKTDNKDHCDIDVAIVCEHICLATEDVGLGTCWVCNFDPYKLKGALSLPENIEPIAIFPIGYPASEECDVSEKKRKSLAEISKWI